MKILTPVPPCDIQWPVSNDLSPLVIKVWIAQYIFMNNVQNDTNKYKSSHSMILSLSEMCVSLYVVGWAKNPV